MYPVAEEDVTYIYQPGFDQPMREPFTCTNYCPADTHYLSALNAFWDRMVRERGWLGNIAPDRLYGWVPREAAGNLCGVADAIWVDPQRRKGRVAAGLDICGAETLAHELGHILNDQGLRHTPNRSHEEDPNCIEVPGYRAEDYPEYPNLPLGSIGEWGVKITGGTFILLDPANTYDFMSYCSPEWISPHNYRRLNQGFAPTGMAVQVLATPQRQILASGIVFTPALTATLNSLFVLTSTIPPDPDSGGAYCLELRDSGDLRLDKRCFDLAFTNPETGEPTGADGFTMVLPYPDGTQAVVLTHNSTELARISASPNVPQVRILSPNGGEIWQSNGTYTVTWAASDADGEMLHYAISFSPDGGASWIPLVLDTTESQWVIDAGRLPGTTSALIRVEVSDGFHTAMDVSDALFTVGRKKPQVFILLPDRDITITPGTPLWLQGYAYDLEDGTLQDTALRWSSSRDGNLGTGSQVLVSLSPGEHVITLTATDSDGNVTTATVRVYVGHKIYLPLVLRNYR
jgi:hypothetical protein